MNLENNLMWRYRGLVFFLCVVSVQICLSPFPVFAADLIGDIGTHYMPTERSIQQHLKWTKIIVTGNSGEKIINIERKRSFGLDNVGLAEGIKVSWIWQIPEETSGNTVTHGLFPLKVTDVSGRVGFTFYDLGTIHKRFVKQVQRQTKRKKFSMVEEQFELANDFYEKIRGIKNSKWPNQADSWNYALYQAAFNQAHQVGLRRINQQEKEKVRAWLKDWISLCIEQESLRYRLAGALQSWSKFSKLAYSRVADWPNTMPQDITNEKLEKIFLKGEFRDWMIEDMVWLQDTVFSNASIRIFLEGKPQLSVLAHQDSGLGISLSLFAQAITDFSKEWQ